MLAISNRIINSSVFTFRSFLSLPSRSFLFSNPFRPASIPLNFNSASVLKRFLYRGYDPCDDINELKSRIERLDCRIREISRTNARLEEQLEESEKSKRGYYTYNNEGDRIYVKTHKDKWDDKKWDDFSPSTMW